MVFIVSALDHLVGKGSELDIQIFSKPDVPHVFKLDIAMNPDIAQAEKMKRGLA
jgi:hypothetical protein